ncbi:hypothetical protein [Planctobacterium marinum]|uniref:hypothetical protein n=1 Tax=Planctobacterium marinum TaxID=1631968 RepID=UPI001E632EB1|nr:hypothetical protein [Planctobacterium marinum]MCC2607557.1 hypothetical protein [Planctobacterium marinum]
MLPSYQVIVKKQLIKVDLEGDWDNKSDLAYLNELALTMRNMQSAPWGLVVDMRGWVVSKETLGFKQKTAFHMDRRNQVVECWIVDNLNQGAHLIHFIEKAKIPLKRCTSVDSAQLWLNQYGFNL